MLAARCFARRNNAHLGMGQFCCLVSVRDREQLPVARHSQREPALLSLAVSLIEDGQRKGVGQYGRPPARNSRRAWRRLIVPCPNPK